MNKRTYSSNVGSRADRGNSFSSESDRGADVAFCKASGYDSVKGKGLGLELPSTPLPPPKKTNKTFCSKFSLLSYLEDERKKKNVLFLLHIARS